MASGSESREPMILSSDDDGLTEISVQYASGVAPGSRSHHQVELCKQLDAANFELGRLKDDLYNVRNDLVGSRTQFKCALTKANAEEKKRKELEEEIAVLRASHKRRKKVDAKKKKKLRAEVSKLRAAVIGAVESRRALERRIELERRRGAGSSGTRVVVKEEID